MNAVLMTFYLYGLQRHCTEASEYVFLPNSIVQNLFLQQNHWMVMEAYHLSVKKEQFKMEVPSFKTILLSSLV